MTGPASTPCLDALEVEFIAGEISQAMNRTYHALCSDQPLSAREAVAMAATLHQRQAALLTTLADRTCAGLVP